jgi:predicted permease
MIRVADDLRNALRALLRAPGFFVLASGTLAIGIAINAAMFSFIDTIFFQPPPYARGRSLYTVELASPRPADASRRKALTLREMDALVAPFGQAAGYSEDHFVVSGGGKTAELVPGLLVDGHTFSVLGVRPRLGRGLTAEDGRPGAPPAVVVGDAFWRARLNGAGTALGRTVRINGVDRTVVGVLPPDFSFPDIARIYLPMDGRDGRVVGRDINVLVNLRDASSTDRLLAALRAAVEGSGTTSVALRPLDEPADAMVVAILAAIAFVLLIACANVANLVLARGTSRVNELVVRSALGASRARLVGHVAAEGVLLTLAAVAGGVLASAWLVDGIAATIPRRELPVWFHPGPDARVLAYVGALAAVSVLVASVLPALTLTRRLPLTTAPGGTRGTADAGSNRLRAGLVVTQIALATLLVTSTGLLIRGYQATEAVSAGYDAGSVLEVSVNRPPVRDAADSFVPNALAGLASLPGTLASGVMAASSPLGWQVADPAHPDQAVAAACVPVTSGALQALGLPIWRGRAFREGEQAEVVVLGRTVARRLFGSESSAIGATVVFTGDPSGARFTVVGVVGDRGFPRVRSPRVPYVYVPIRHGNPKDVAFVVRPVSGDPRRLAAAVTGVLARLDADLVVAPARTMLDVERERVGDVAWFISLFGGFGIAAILLAALGIHGVVAYAVSRRVRELGVRLALGASRARIVRQVARSMLPAAAWGLGLGTALAWGMGALLQAVVFGVSKMDWLTLAAVGTLFLLVTLGASLVPALRAARLDPVQALRAE